MIKCTQIKQLDGKFHKKEKLGNKIYEIMKAK